MSGAPSPNSSRGRKRMARLRRRVLWLSHRDNNDYDRAEASALKWALVLIEELAAEQQREMIERFGSTGSRAR